MILGNESNLCNFAYDDIIIKNNLSEKEFGLTIDSLDFSDPISNTCDTANQKSNVLFTASARLVRTRINVTCTA